MNTKILTDKILDILDKYEFVTSIPIDIEKLKSEIENEILKEYELKHYHNYDTIS